jgi:hypothetical protein
MLTVLACKRLLAQSSYGVFPYCTKHIIIFKLGMPSPEGNPPPPPPDALVAGPRTYKPSYGLLAPSYQFNSLDTSNAFSQGRDGALPMAARRAKRENGGLGEDPPVSTMTYNRSFGPGCSVKPEMELYPWQCAERSEKTGVWGRIPQEVR